MFFSFGYDVTYSLNFSWALDHSPSVMRSRALRNTTFASLELCWLDRLGEAELELARCCATAAPGIKAIARISKRNRHEDMCFVVAVFLVRVFNICLPLFS